MHGSFMFCKWIVAVSKCAKNVSSLFAVCVLLAWRKHRWVEHLAAMTPVRWLRIKTRQPIRRYRAVQWLGMEAVLCGCTWLCYRPKQSLFTLCISWIHRLVAVAAATGQWRPRRGRLRRAWRLRIQRLFGSKLSFVPSPWPTRAFGSWWWAVSWNVWMKISGVCWARCFFRTHVRRLVSCATKCTMRWQ